MGVISVIDDIGWLVGWLVGWRDVQGESIRGR